MDSWYLLEVAQLLIQVLIHCMLSCMRPFLKQPSAKVQSASLTDPRGRSRSEQTFLRKKGGELMFKSMLGVLSVYNFLYATCSELSWIWFPPFSESVQSTKLVLSSPGVTVNYFVGRGTLPSILEVECKSIRIPES